MHQLIGKIARDAGASAIAAAYHDYETEAAWSVHGERLFHAASTIKVAVLAGVFRAIDEGTLAPDSRVHVRNRFLSVVDGSPFRVASSRDANSEVHSAIGRNMRVSELALHMIATSSNLATNLLVDVVGVEYIRAMLERMGISGIDFRRGVEDERAFNADVNNLVTANGLLALFRAIQEETVFSPESSKAMLEILHRQEFKSGIPAGVPSSVRAKVAHKTGEISTIAHDAGLVFFPRRKPYAVAVLTAWEENKGGRMETIASVSNAIYDHLVHKDAHRESREKGGGNG